MEESEVCLCVQISFVRLECLDLLIDLLTETLMGWWVWFHSLLVRGITIAEKRMDFSNAENAVQNTFLCSRTQSQLRCFLQQRSAICLVISEAEWVIHSTGLDIQ